MAEAVVCVTGGGGYIAGHVCKRLRAGGCSVRATVRSKATAQVGFLEAMGVEIFEGCDLLVPGSFDAAVAGCRFVHHCASPFQTTPPGGNAYEGFVRPALEGTKNVLEAAKKAGTVKRVIVTSSTAAVTHTQAPEGKDKVWTEDDWQTEDTVESKPYRYSKRLAEQAAWDFVQDDAVGFDLVTILPSWVMGPVLNTRTDAASVRIMKSLIDGSSTKVTPMAFGAVDVRDVAEAHFRVMALELAPGSPAFNKHGQVRFIVGSERCYSLEEFAKTVATKAEFAGLQVPTEREEVPLQSLTYSNCRTREILGIELCDPSTSMTEGLRSLLDLGVVPRPANEEASKKRKFEEGGEK